MKKRHFDPPLKKRYMTSRNGYTIHTIDPFAIRNIAKPDEEFDNFSTKDEFPDLIPEGEIWISYEGYKNEAEYFILDAVTRLEKKEEGMAEEEAYEAGVIAERKLRARRSGFKYRGEKPHARVPPKVYGTHYTTLPDEKFPIEVWRVNGSAVRSIYKTDYTEGGHGYVYRWIPKNEIWVEEGIDKAELPLIVAHEYTELRLMREKKIAYDKAHEICSAMEYKLRKGDSRSKFPFLGKEKLKRGDLSKLTGEEWFHYVLKHFVD